MNFFLGEMCFEFRVCRATDTQCNRMFMSGMEMLMAGTKFLSGALFRSLTSREVDNFRLVEA